MHIIFGDAVKEIPNSFTVLELDTFKMSNNQTATAYCVVEKIPLAEFAMIEAHKELHANLLQYYRKQQWNYCEQAINALMGKWNGEIDSFYTELLTRIEDLKNNPPEPDWNGYLTK
jgi:hypothetical protein